ncbi:MAG: nucleotidyltransferase domain-containing protein [Rothia sp. (in: high G+C Gram-positive bacteria)]|uniref:nucleotidyltransferase family protein n=1 Tax=Rothia sp. (in: high G+C Gram-positive bacteria) TaxID=1885016 RepID=UPI0026DEC2A4|nr:nucleotidyltransferase domain-containing protein [Rothia sp. (in: high G+C Gram-positive bacteria)]MDO5750675.1 nucleotidyltransferase domain-containing protein [Rothia sp. (in: high G+C Gram-positive bacteria)]
MSTPQIVVQSLIPHQEQALDVLRAYGVQQAYLFGSAARGELTESSDIDLLITMPTGRGLSAFRRVALKLELERVIGRPVDVLDHLNPVFEPYIRADMVELPL